GAEPQMRRAVLLEQIVERDPSRAVRAADFGLGSEHQQHRRGIAAIGGVAAVSRRRHVTNRAAVLEAEIVASPPPRALVIENATRIEAEIAAESGARAMGRAGDGGGGLGKRRKPA